MHRKGEKILGKDLPVLEVNNLKTYFKIEQGTVKAVDGVDFKINSGETLGLVGESGCGKSVTVKSIIRIIPSPPGEIVDGNVFFYKRDNGKTNKIDLVQLQSKGKEIRKIRGNDIAMIFQEPMTAFSPVHTIGNQINEAILLHQDVNKNDATEIAINMLDRVGISSPEERVNEYLHQFSGGMRQRAMIAMALCCNPSLLIADEPTTALDVTIQAQILELIEDLQNDFGMSVLYITHDLGVIAEIADNVGVMYLGKIVEYADVDTIFHNPYHPYTRALIKSIPKITTGADERLQVIEGSVPDPFQITKGCNYLPRCIESIDKCKCDELPPVTEVEDGHIVRCFKYSEEGSYGTTAVKNKRT